MAYGTDIIRRTMFVRKTDTTASADIIYTYFTHT